jgi:hypothetical protein
MGATVYLQAVSTSTDTAVWQVDTGFGSCQDQAQKNSPERRQALAENSLVKPDPLHAIWHILCQIAGQWQADLENEKDRIATNFLAAAMSKVLSLAKGARVLQVWPRP